MTRALPQGGQDEVGGVAERPVRSAPEPPRGLKSKLKRPRAKIRSSSKTAVPNLLDVRNKRRQLVAAAEAEVSAVGGAEQPEAGETLVEAEAGETLLANTQASGTLLGDQRRSWLLMKVFYLKENEQQADRGLDAYVLGEALGKGSSGTCCKAAVRATSERVVVKQFHKPDFHAYHKEVGILSELQHPNIVRLLDVAIRPALFMVMSFAGTCLQDIIHESKTGLPEFGWKSMTWQLMKALDYLHSMCVMHRDVKPDNMAVSESGLLSLLDFGLASVFSPDIRESRFATAAKDTSKGIVYCTLYYRAIELLLSHDAYGKEVDLWAAGCCLFEMMTGNLLFHPCPQTCDGMFRRIFWNLGHSSRR